MRSSMCSALVFGGLAEFPQPATADLSATDVRQPRQAVCKVTGLTPGKYSVSIANRGLGAVVVDALIVR